MEDDILDRPGGRRYTPDRSLGEWRDVHAELPLYRKLSHSDNAVLAAFDPETFAVWGNDGLSRAMRLAERRNQKLRDEDVETLVHEFARCLEYENLFEDCRDRNHLREMIRSRLMVTVARASEESFMNRQLRQERLAEETVQRVRMELLSAFDRMARGQGLKGREILDKAEDRADRWTRSQRDGYREKARNDYRRLVTIETARTPTGTRQLQLVPLRRMRRLLPTAESPTLAALVDKLVDADLVLVLPADRRLQVIRAGNLEELAGLAIESPSRNTPVP